MRLGWIVGLVLAGPASAHVELTNCAVNHGVNFGPVATCDAENTGPVAVSAFGYAYRATEQGRATPWAERGHGDIGRKYAAVPGGIEPGETVSVTLSIGPLPDRADPTRVKYEFTVREVIGPDGQTVSAP